MRLGATPPGTRDQGPGTKDRGPARGFTLIELLVVIIVLAILVALLLPAINAALRTARQAAVQAEINQLATALESFKAKYGDYPPSRFLCVEDGWYTRFFSNNGSLDQPGNVQKGPTDPTSLGAGDIMVGQLAQRSAAYLRKFWPRVNTSSLLPAGVWYDFNGNGNLDPPYILHGHECLVFFLGGVPLASLDPQTGQLTGKFGLTGFGKDPTNPFTNSLVANKMYSGNRQPGLFEFNPGRLFADPNNTSLNGGNPGIPGYYDSLSNPTPPPVGSPTVNSTLNFYAYFSAYGNSSYDPNDVNFPEQDSYGTQPNALQFQVSFPVIPYKTGSGPDLSPSPNPYTSTTTVTATGTVTYQKPQTFQIISSGVDGQYGVGGQLLQSTTVSGLESLPLGVPASAPGTALPNPYTYVSDNSIRQREMDNLTNFKSGTLGQ